MADEKFFADHMLGRLSKWLRMMGFDVEYPGKDDTDSDIVDRCESEGRILLTRDHELYSRFSRSIMVESENFKDQVVQFISSFHPDEEEYFTRCTECNGLLAGVMDINSVEEVPDSVKERGLTVWKCEKCSKIYWKGSHYENILKQIRKFEAEAK